MLWVRWSNVADLVPREIIQSRFSMLRFHRVVLWCALLLLGVLLLAACGPTPSATPVPVPTATKIVTPIATLPPVSPTPVLRTLTFCLATEPDSLYFYGDNGLAETNVLSAIYDGPIDTLSYDYQPVILEKIPFLNDGDAVIRAVPVGVGSLVQTVGQGVLELTPDVEEPILLRPAGCRSDDCAVPWLPISGTLEMDQLVVTFTLRAGVAWASGVPVTAYDSLYSFQLAQDPATPNVGSREVLERTASYTSTDARTTVWMAVPGYLDTNYMTRFWTPLPQHQWGDLAAQELVTADVSARTPMGYGPFTVQEWVAGERIVLVKNPYYFRANEGLPRVDQIVYRFVGRDAETSIAALLSGTCDILSQDTLLDPGAAAEQPVQLLLDLEQQGQVDAIISTTPIYEHLDISLLPADPTLRPDFFGELRMREVIAMCLDREKIVSDLFYGYSPIMASYIPREHPLYNPTVRMRTYDPSVARSILYKMGWQDRDRDGVRESYDVAGIPDGTRLSLRWITSKTFPRPTYVQTLQASLAECGFEVQLEYLAAQDLYAPGPEGPLVGRRFDLASYSWLTALQPPCELYMSTEIPTPENGWTGHNYAGYNNVAYDNACQRAREALPGEPEYIQYHQVAQRIWAEDLPSLPLYMRIKVAASQPGVYGFLLDPTETSEMWNVEKIGFSSLHTSPVPTTP